MSYIYTSYNTTTRMTGLTGLDVDGLVYQLMRVERLKVDAVSRNRQLLVWKQEQYREIISALQNFSNEYFNALKPATDMRNSSIYNAFAVKYDGQDTNPYFSVSAVSGAKAGNYIIKNIVTAKTARILGSEAAGHLTGKPLGTLEINSDKGNNVFAVEFNGVKKTIILEDDPSDIYALKEDLQNKLDDAFGTGKISVDTSEDGTRLIFRTDKTNTLDFENIEWLQGDVTKLPLASGGYDIYVSFETLEHLPVDSVGSYFTEALRVLKNGGKMILSTPNKKARAGINNPFHVKEYTFSELDNILRKYFDSVDYYSGQHEIKPGADETAKGFIAVCHKA
ncbi:MAG TPA: flagellar cap protein FliD N-terminal domain-containing protein [Clostridiales bacterium]|nr:flagellar cap protein FliD N-terminal domain-containing protein [Clostridiales bacterium]HPV01405.1 flagellar cap protein FliD N-terminal domain-containing protein [Clostridiales bacterium]